jgi:hypothetical protein
MSRKAVRVRSSAHLLIGDCSGISTSGNRPVEDTGGGFVHAGEEEIAFRRATRHLSRGGLWRNAEVDARVGSC